MVRNSSTHPHWCSFTSSFRFSSCTSSQARVIETKVPYLSSDADVQHPRHSCGIRPLTGFDKFTVPKLQYVYSIIYLNSWVESLVMHVYLYLLTCYMLYICFENVPLISSQVASLSNNVYEVLY